MEKVRIYQYYSFGFNYCWIRGLSLDSSNQKLKDELERYLKFISDLNLQVTLSAIDLKGLKADIMQLAKICKNKISSNEQVNPTTHAKIIQKLHELDIVLDAELNIKIGYILDEKRFSNKYLTENIDNLFAKSTFLKIPSLAQYDFQESGLCLVFDRFTASAFHALRGTECVLKEYYCLLLTKTTKETETWSTFVNAINSGIKKGSISPPPDEELMINLESLRKYYRNKTQHPQLVYNSDESQDLLVSCIKAVNEIIEDLIKRNLK